MAFAVSIAPGSEQSHRSHSLLRIAVPSGVPNPVHAFQPGPALYPCKVFMMVLVPSVTSTTTPFAAFAYRKGFRKPTFFPFAWLILAIRAAMSGATALVPPDLTSDESTRTR